MKKSWKNVWRFEKKYILLHCQLNINDKKNDRIEVWCDVTPT